MMYIERIKGAKNPTSTRCYPHQRLQGVNKCHHVSRQVASECSCNCAGVRNPTFSLRIHGFRHLRGATMKRPNGCCQKNSTDCHVERNHPKKNLEKKAMVLSSIHFLKFLSHLPKYIGVYRLPHTQSGGVCCLCVCFLNEAQEIREEERKREKTRLEGERRERVCEREREGKKKSERKKRERER